MTAKIKDILIRTVKTMAETAIAAIGTCTLLQEVNWQVVLSTTLLSGIVTVLFNIAHFEDQKK